MTTPELTFAALSLGSNLGARLFHIESMEQALRSVLTGDVRASRVMETAPVGVSAVGQPAYLNKVVTGCYGGGAYELLEACLSIEAALGRTRPEPKAPRTADIDILLFGGAVISDPPGLVVPHPELLNRRFCLEGLMDIDPLIQINISGEPFTVDYLHKNMRVDVVAQDVYFL